MLDHRALVAVTGVQAAGKSTAARLLAQRFTRGVHVEADALQRMIVSGGVLVERPEEPSGEAEHQLRLRLHHACMLGRSFFEAGFSVVLDDIIIGDRWRHLQEELSGHPVSLVVLAPSVQSVFARDRSRAKPALGEAWARYLDRELRHTLAGVGLWIDSSDQTPDDTVDAIVRSLWP